MPTFTEFTLDSPWLPRRAPEKTGRTKELHITKRTAFSQLAQARTALA